LHANELPWRARRDESVAGLNRYPEPQPRALLERLAALYEVPCESLLLGRGSDEGIDLLIRGFCRAGRDRIIICPPTFGMYEVAARIQGAGVMPVPLRRVNGFALDDLTMLQHCSPEVKLIFLCSPNNPTGNRLSEDAILRLARVLLGKALLVIDEAYVEFAGTGSLSRHIQQFPNLAVLRTLSKAYALAGARCGALIAHPEVIALLHKIVPPYAISQLTLEAVLKVLEPAEIIATAAQWEVLRSERDRVQRALAKIPGVLRVWPSEANFILAEFDNPTAALVRTHRAGLLIRDVRTSWGLPHALRITIGTREVNERLLQALA
jgi:histidinol-phosphate aminotransferase